MKAVGLPIAVQSAVAEVKKVAKAVTSARGGEGAVREAIEMILRKEGRWEGALRSFENESSEAK
jgi:3-deoxy-D-manno-octulosonate 8-phosphate phosphatase (KDO 8-P phosphatase)